MYFVGDGHEDKFDNSKKRTIAKCRFVNVFNNVLVNVQWSMFFTWYISYEK